jgi:hypothetical protein
MAKAYNELQQVAGAIVASDRQGCEEAEGPKNKLAYASARLLQNKIRAGVAERPGWGVSGGYKTYNCQAFNAEHESVRSHVTRVGKGIFLP